MMYMFQNINKKQLRQSELHSHLEQSLINTT